MENSETDNAVTKSPPLNLHLPASDRSFWRGSDELALQYLAWGRREFGNETIPTCKHAGWVCFIIEEGRPVITVEDRRLKLNRQEVYIAGPDCSIGWEAQHAVDCKLSLWMWNRFDDPIFIPHKGKFQRLSLSQKELGAYLEIHDLCRRESMSIDSHSPNYFEGCRRLFETRLIRLLENDTRKGNRSEKLSQATDWMSEHLDSREPIARLCDYLSMSQSTLHRFFKQHLGVSPAAHFHSLKMKKAQELVTAQGMSVKEIAYSLGYEHFHDFSRAYKKFYGKSPTD